MAGILSCEVICKSCEPSGATADRWSSRCKVDQGYSPIEEYRRRSRVEPSFAKATEGNPAPQASQGENSVDKGCPRISQIHGKAVAVLSKYLAEQLA